MNKLLKFINKDKVITIRFLIIFLILVYIPMALYINFVTIRTIDAVEEEKKEDIEQILRKTSQSINFALDNIQNGVLEIANHKGIQAGVQNFDNFAENYKSKMSAFTEQQFRVLQNNIPYIDEYACISKNGTIISSSSEIVIDPEKFFKSDSYKKLLLNNNLVWNNDISDYIYLKTSDEKLFHLVYRIKDLDNFENVGYCFVTINSDRFKALYQDTYIGHTGGVVIFDENNNSILSKGKHNLPKNQLDLLVEKQLFYKMKSVDISEEEHLLGIAPLFPMDWYLVATVPRSELTKTVQKNLKNNFTPIILASLATALVLVIETLILSKVVTEKEMANYRLVLSEKMNEKLRMYKHDFTNHLQIIWGLMELKHYDKALNYLIKASNEGITIKEKYEIGVPEIESTIFSTLSKAREKNIEVEIDCITLQSDLPIKIYDLTKILSNLLKNAMYSLEKAESNEKKLKIRIYEELGDYVFEVINNVPIIPEEMREKIFEKGFTTKGKEGSGLGLHIVKRLVQKNRGAIELHVDEEGNHFTVRFPY